MSSSLIRPRTPISAKQLAAASGSQSLAAPSTPTGAWKHPQFDEIARRQNASTFTSANFKTLLINIGALLAFEYIGGQLWISFPRIFLSSGMFGPYPTGVFYLLQLVCVFNSLTALYPFILQVLDKKDDFSDIPLTPTQRKLLGLKPSSRPDTPDSVYVTPPRYKRTPSSTPLSGSPASRDSNIESPSSRRRGSIGSFDQSSTATEPYDLLNPSRYPANRGNNLDATYSPDFSSRTHWQKATLGNQKRNSYGSPSPLGPSVGRGADAPGSPSPAATKGASVGLTNKYIYDKGRRNSIAASRLYA